MNEMNMDNLISWILGFLILLMHSCVDNSYNYQVLDDQTVRPIHILFLGHSSDHHNSKAYAPILASMLAHEGVQITYTEDPNSLNPETLDQYDGLLIYANHESITDDQEQALLDYVAAGHGFIPIHSASYCFLNSEKYIHLVGGQFMEHDTGTFTVPIIHTDHPIMQSLEEFSTWDETYVHHKMTDDRTVLMERKEGDHREPWTWVKEYGKGRVFYTAYGHDERTWSHPGFQNLVKEGILWAVGEHRKELWKVHRASIPELAYRSDDNIPNYENRDPKPQYQLPLSPEESAKRIHVPVDLELQLFASEPDIINPISMEWDEKGRLWVIETVDYPNTVRQEDGVGDDRIKICEDTDGDGRADKFTLFADKLNIPTSMVFANGGLIVSQAPHFMFLKDTDGDDKADHREVLFSGWGTFDTHAGPSNLTYGIDNQIWGVVGYSGFDGDINGLTYKFGQGIYRFARSLDHFEFMAKTSNNTWGFGINDHYDVFASTANNTHSVHLSIPDRVLEGIKGIASDGAIKIDGHYAMHPMTDKVRQVDVFGGFTAASGHHFYTAKDLPSSYWGTTALVCEPTGHLVHMAKIEKDGAGYMEKDGWNIFSSSDEWVAPVEAKTGPDGAIWVLDWYNFIIQHNPTPSSSRGGYDAVNGEGNAYENPLRDKGHGRIWRIVPKGDPLINEMSLDASNSEALLIGLQHNNSFWRFTAQRLLVENKDLSALPQLIDLLDKNSSSTNEQVAVHALWTIHGILGKINNDKYGQVLLAALDHNSPVVRKEAVKALPLESWANEAIFEKELLQDPDPHTQLEVLVRIAQIDPSDEIGSQIYALNKKESVQDDVWLSRAIYAAAVRHKEGFLEGLMAENPTFTKETPEYVQREMFDLDDSDWPRMNLPTFIEDAGVDMDGVIWFRKQIELSEDQANQTAYLSLGTIDDKDETFLNGQKIGEMDKWDDDREYKIAPGILKTGQNVIAVKVVDDGGGGGLYGKDEHLFLQIGQQQLPLAGEWKYAIEEEFLSGNSKLFEKTTVVDLFIENYFEQEEQPSAEEKVLSNSGEITTIEIKSVVNEMKYDRETFTVKSGQFVKIVFGNPDFMQHNLLIGKPGSLEMIGKAADELSTQPDGVDRDYIPDISQILYATKLVNPQDEVELKFVAPEPGEYPYVCTFPGHWRIMNGVMKVIPSKENL